MSWRNQKIEKEFSNLNLNCINNERVQPSNHNIWYDRPAIYAFFKFPGDILYIGQTDNLNRRTNEHYAKEESNILLSKELNNTEAEVYLTYTIVPFDEAKRKEIEKELIKKLTPICNIQNN